MDDLFLNDLAYISVEGCEPDPIQKVKDLADTIRESRDPEAVIAAFDKDPIFHEAFNSNGINALQNMDNYITASEEGFWQDFWNHGLVGAIFCHFAYENLKSIASSISSPYSSDLNLEKKRSIYLPSAEETEKLLGVLENIQKVFNTFVSNPKADFKKTVQSIRNAGIEIKANGKVIDFNESEWFRAFLGAWAGNFIDVAIAPIPFLGQINMAGNKIGGISVGRVVMRRFFSKNGAVLSERGWTIDKLNRARVRALNLINNLCKLSTQKTTVEGFERNEENRCKIKFMTTMIDAQTTALKRLGRGLVAVKENKF